MNKIKKKDSCFKNVKYFRLKWPSLLVFAATFWVYHAVVSILWLNQSNTLKLLKYPFWISAYAGQYVLDLMDTYGAGFAILWIAFWECVGFMWIYGVKNVCKDIKLMIGSEPGWFWKITWAGVAPIFLLVIFIASVVQWEKPQYVSQYCTRLRDYFSYFAWFLFSGTTVTLHIPNGPTQ